MIEIIPMTEGHIDEICEIEKDCFSVPWSRDMFLEEFDRPTPAYYFIAADAGMILGYAGMWHIINEGHITNIAVRPEHRRSGIGQRLLDKLIETAMEQEMIGLTLEVRMNNTPAQGLYAKNGFKPEGIRKNYYPETREDAVIMWRYL